MSNKPVSIHSVVFNEHPHVFRSHGDPHVFDIIVDQPFSHEQYREILFETVFEIGLSEFVPFLDYHCAQLKDPMPWLNALEKLIHCYTRRFNDPDLEFRRDKLLLEIGGTRREIKVSAERPMPKKPKKNINGFSDEKEYCFTTVKEKLEEFETLEEKISYLNDQVTEYQQNPPSYVSTIAKPFDEQCDLEIKNLEKREEMRQKTLLRLASEMGSAGLTEKAKITCNLNIFVDALFQMMHSVMVEGKSILEASNTQVAMMLSSNCLDKNGNPISVRAVQTILEVNRPEKRPPEYRRLHISWTPPKKA